MLPVVSVLGDVRGVRRFGLLWGALLELAAVGARVGHLVVPGVRRACLCIPETPEVGASDMTF